MTSETTTLRSAEPLRLLRKAAAHLFPHWGLWVFPLALFMVNMTWIGLSPRLSFSTHSVLSLALVLVGTPLALAYAHWRRTSFDRTLGILFRTLMVALFAGLFTQSINIFSHLGMTLNMPLADGLLQSWDNALGFDWNGYAGVMASHGWSRAVLALAYNAFFGVALGAIIVGAISVGRYDRVEELAFIALTSGFICVSIAALLPAEDAWNTVASPHMKALTGAWPGPWLGQFRALRGSGPVVIDTGTMEGLATFPSFHTCLAIMIIWCSRGRWFTLLPGTVFGLAVLAATPIFGGHYGVDLLGGAAVMASVIAAWRWIAPPRRSGGGRP